MSRKRRLKPLYTVAEAAALIGRSRWAIYRYIKRGELSTIAIGGITYVPIAGIQKSYPSLLNSIKIALSSGSIGQLELDL